MKSKEYSLLQDTLIVGRLKETQHLRVSFLLSLCLGGVTVTSATITIDLTH